MNRATRYSPEVQERGVRKVLDHQAESPLAVAAMGSIAAKMGCTVEALRSGVRPERPAMRIGIFRGAVAEKHKSNVQVL